MCVGPDGSLAGCSWSRSICGAASGQLAGHGADKGADTRHSAKSTPISLPIHTSRSYAYVRTLKTQGLADEGFLQRNREEQQQEQEEEEEEQQ